MIIIIIAIAIIITIVNYSAIAVDVYLFFGGRPHAEACQNGMIIYNNS